MNKHCNPSKCKWALGGKCMCGRVQEVEKLMDAAYARGQLSGTDGKKPMIADLKLMAQSEFELKIDLENSMPLDDRAKMYKEEAEKVFAPDDHADGYLYEVIRGEIVDYSGLDENTHKTAKAIVETIKQPLKNLVLNTMQEGINLKRPIDDWYWLSIAKGIDDL